MEFNSGIFERDNRDQLKAIILTPEGGLSTEQRWARETPYTAQLLIDGLGLQAGDVVADFGCGIGRLAKELLTRIDIRIIGVDISKSMQRESLLYVDDPRFCPMHYRLFVELCGAGQLHFTHAYAVYVLQHCENPREAIRALSQGGPKKLFALNMAYRVMPVADKANNRYPWVDDKFSVDGEIAGHFPQVRQIALDPAHISLTDKTWAAVFSR